MSAASAKTQRGKQYRPGRSQRRNAEFTELLRALYDDTCQVCGLQLCDANGQPGRSQVHHLQPWDGDHSDRLDNVICLCPNDHARFELGTLRLDATGLLELTGGEWLPRPLTVDLHLTKPLRVSAGSAAPTAPTHPAGVAASPS